MGFIYRQKTYHEVDDDGLGLVLKSFNGPPPPTPHPPCE